MPDLSASLRQTTDQNDEMILMGIFGAKATEKCPVIDCEFESVWCHPINLCSTYSASLEVLPGAPK